MGKISQSEEQSMNVPLLFLTYLLTLPIEDREKALKTYCKNLRRRNLKLKGKK